MVRSILLLLTDPDGFFSRDPKDWSGLSIPALLVLITGIIGALSAYIVTRVMVGIIPESMLAGTGIMSLMGIFGALGALLMVFVAWIAYTLVFFLISLVFMGRGPFTRALAAVGYGYLPTVIGGIINLLLLWYYVPSITVSRVKDPSEIQAAMAAITHSTVFQVTAVIGIIFLLLSANIWIFGIRSSREIPLRNAAITVAIPVLAYILLTLLFTGVFS